MTDAVAAQRSVSGRLRLLCALLGFIGILFTSANDLGLAGPVLVLGAEDFRVEDPVRFAVAVAGRRG